MRRLILGLAWLAVVQATTVDVSEKLAQPETMKIKRYLNHGHETSSPCPPFYPHFHMPPPVMHRMPPYGPPVYPKSEYGPPMHHQQFIHQPAQTYIPKPTVQYAKPQVSVPVYQHHQQPIHHVQPIIKAQPNYWPMPQLHQNYEKPHHAYAPNYHVPMFIPTTQKDWIKPINYHAQEANSHNLKMPGIVYKNVQNCPPCAANQHISHQIHQQQPVYQHHSLHQHQQSAPQIIHEQPTYAKPIIHQSRVHPSPHYLPAPLQSPIVKHHEHIEPCAK